MDELKELLLEAARIGAEAGAKAAMEKLDKERSADRTEFADRRLHNTKLLLRNYRMFKTYVANAVFEYQEEFETPEQIMADLMRPNSSTNFVDGIKRSVARTATMVTHMETMVGLYQAYCYMKGTPEEERRWRVIDGLYINDEPKTVEELADMEYVNARTIYRDIDIACERIAALMFGIDGLKK